MTSYHQALAASDALTEQLQNLFEDRRFIPRFFDTLFSLRTALGSAQDRFTGMHGSGDGELSVFATVIDRCEQALALGRTLTPGDAAVSRYVGAVDRAATALRGDTAPTVRSELRGTLRLRGAIPTGFRHAGRLPPPPEPYYTSLVKLFPVEAVMLYPLAIGIAAGDTVTRLLLIALITFFVIVLRWFATQEESGGDEDRVAIAVSVISFLLYAASLGGFGYLPGGPEQTSQLLAFITVMWVALVPYALRRARR